jgi:hypothetical protein
VARTGLGGPGERRLNNGRFNDDRVTGSPLAGYDGEDRFYLIPTDAGILRLDSALQPVAIHVPPFPGLAEGKTPEVLLALAPDRFAYATAEGRYSLGPERLELGPLAIAAPDDYLLEDIRRGQDGSYLARWVTRDQKGRTRLRAEDFSTFPINRRYFDLRAVPRFVQRRLQWGDPQPWLMLDFEPGRIVFGIQEDGRQFVQPLPAGFTLMEPLFTDRGVLLIGAREMWHIDVATLLDQLMAQTAP